MEVWIDPSKIRVPAYELKDTGRNVLNRLAKAGLQPAKDELKRRDEILKLQSQRHKHKTDWDASNAPVLDMDVSSLNDEE